MEPRLPKSIKWTPVPAEFLSQVDGIFAESFKDRGQGFKFSTRGRIYPNELLVAIGRAKPGQLKQDHFYVSLEYKPGKDNVMKLLHLAVDALAALFEQLFNAEGKHDPDESIPPMEWPKIWQELTFEKRTIFVQHTTENPELDAAADAILKGRVSKNDGLAQGDWESSAEVEQKVAITPELIKAQLGVTDDHGDDDGSSDDNLH